MSFEHTLSILKPHVIRNSIIGKVNSYIEKVGLKIVATRMTNLTRDEAEHFYAEHKERPFFSKLIDTVTSGPVILQVLKGINAIKKYRDIMGDTNPENASTGTIRGDLAESIDENCVHGSDSAASAEKEINFFFKKEDIHS